MIEQNFPCPYCYEEISIQIDPSVAQQSYVEDCEVCCHHIQITYHTDGEELTYFLAEPVNP